MSNNIDYRDLDGVSPVARRGGGSGRAVAMAALGIILIGGLAWINWPRGPSDQATQQTDETFETTTFRAPDPTAPSEAPPPNETIVIPDAQPEEQVQAPNPDQVVTPGVDLEQQRLFLEQQMREAEARRLAEEEARRREEEAKRLAEEEALRKEREAQLAAERAKREQELWEQLRSPQLILDADDQEQGGQPAQVTEEGMIQPATAGGGAGGENGGRQNSSSAFLAQMETGGGNAGAKATWNRRTDALIAEGTMIRGFLETAINSDLPGMVRAVVREDVWSLDGRRVLIPKGSRLTGEYQSGLTRGQTRVFIVWNRVIRSDGVSVRINSMGADNLGRSGMSGRLDTHWRERFGSAIALSIVGGGAEYLGSLAKTNDRGREQTTVTRVDPVTGEVFTTTIDPPVSQDEARQIGLQRVASTLSDLAKEAFQDSRNIPPTLYVDQGSPVVVFVRRDLDFSALYADPVQEELARLKRGGLKKEVVDPVPLYMTPKDNFYPAAPTK